MRNIIKHPFINLIFFVALFAFSGCTNEMEPDIAGNSNLPADGTPLTVRATASGFTARRQPRHPHPGDGGHEHQVPDGRRHRALLRAQKRIWH